MSDAPMSAVLVQMMIDAAPEGAESVAFLRGPMVAPLIGERVKLASDLKFMKPRRRHDQT
jgi:hypothetical protein